MSRFRTIEISDPAFERDGLRYITVKSDVLRGRGDITLFIPSGLSGDEPLPLLILLHGVYGSHWCWSLKGGAHRTAQRLIDAGKIAPLLIAMPSDGLWGDGSGYVPHKQRDFEQWIVREVPAAVQEATAHASADTPLHLAGLSMGGYGALRLGSKYANRFRSISAHSAITCWEEMKRFVEEDCGLFQPPTGERNAIDLLVENREQLPPLRFDCGRKDPLLTGNRRLHRQLLEAGIAHEYQEFSGAHEWPYWRQHLEDTLLFLA